MISIDGLTKKQKTMLDIMWSMDSLEEIHAWQATLPLEDQYLCEVLMKLVALAFIDEAVDQDSSLSEAKQVIDHVSQK